MRTGPAARRACSIGLALGTALAAINAGFSRSFGLACEGLVNLAVPPAYWSPADLTLV